MTLGNKGVGKVLCLRLQRQLLLVVVTLFLLFTASREFKKQIKLQSLKITRKQRKLQKKEKLLLELRSRRGENKFTFV